MSTAVGSSILFLLVVLSLSSPSFSLEDCSSTNIGSTRRSRSPFTSDGNGIISNRIIENNNDIGINAANTNDVSVLGSDDDAVCCKLGPLRKCCAKPKDDDDVVVTFSTGGPAGRLRSKKGSLGAGIVSMLTEQLMKDSNLNNLNNNINVELSNNTGTALDVEAGIATGETTVKSMEILAERMMNANKNLKVRRATDPIIQGSTETVTLSKSKPRVHLKGSNNGVFYEGDIFASFSKNNAAIFFDELTFQGTNVPHMICYINRFVSLTGPQFTIPPSNCAHLCDGSGQCRHYFKMCAFAKDGGAWVAVIHRDITFQLAFLDPRNGPRAVTTKIVQPMGHNCDNQPPGDYWVDSGWKIRANPVTNKYDVVIEAGTMVCEDYCLTTGSDHVFYSFSP